MPFATPAPVRPLLLTGPEQAQVAARVFLKAADTLTGMRIEDAALAAAIGALVKSIEDRRPGSQLSAMVARLMEER